MRRSNFSDFGDFESMIERMARQFEEMNRQLEGSFGPASATRSRLPAFSGTSTMSLDVADHGDELVVTADVPGFEKEDIDVSITERTLTIDAEREMEQEQERESETGEYIRRERSHTSMRRSIPLPVDVDESAASASYRHGVLSITLPKLSADEDSHRIDVN